MLAEPTPPIALNALAVDPPAGTASTVDIAAAMTVTIAGQPFTLTGKFDNSDIIVEYHREFSQAASLGTITSIADEIEAGLHFTGLSASIKSAHDQVKGLGPVQGALDAITSATIRITDLVINTKTKTYGIGLALDFTTSNPLPKVFGITLISLGFSITKVNENQAPAKG
jgi:hypothetical protein